MSKRNSETFTAICDALCIDPSLTRACEVSGVNVATAFRWMKDELSNPGPYTFEYGEYGVMTFGEAIKLCQKIQNVLHISEMRSRARFGFREQIVFQGKLQYADDPRFVGWSDDEMVALGFDPKRDRILFDEHGLPVPLTVQRQPSDALQIAIARAYGGPEWTERKEIDMRHSGGVMIVGKQAPPPRAIPAPVAVAMIERAAEDMVAEEIVTEEIEREAERDVAYEADAVTTAAEDDVATAAEETSDAQLIPEIEPPTEESAPEVAEVSAALDPVAVGEADQADGVAEPPIVTDLKKRLAEQLAKAAEKTKAAPTGGYIPMALRVEAWKIAKRDSDDQDHIGRGSPPPGAVSVR